MGSVNSSSISIHRNSRPNKRFLSRRLILDAWKRTVRAVPFWLTMLMFLATALFARSRAASLSNVDPEYIVALSTANRFLHAWQIQDQETGILMLSDTLKQQSSVDRLQTYFSGSAQQAFEISRGKRLRPGCYTFPVAIFDSRASDHQKTRPHSSRIVVIHTGKNDWAVARLP